MLNEVLYDPPGADAGYEFVEILNIGAAPVLLHEVELQVGDGARPETWRTAWRSAGQSLQPWVPWVVGGDSVRVRHAALGASLQNGPDAVRLWRAGAVLDLLGYGDLHDARLYETRPAADVSGLGLARIPDGLDRDDNGLDWQAAAPSPGRRNLPEREWRVQLVTPDPTRLWPYRALVVHARVHNRGRVDLEPGAWRARAWLRRFVTEPYLDGPGLGEPEALPVDLWSQALAAGDSVELRLPLWSSQGLLQLEVEVAGTDEDSTDNRATHVLRVGAGDVVIHEILYAPHPGGAEWIELHNRGTRPHPLQGWTLADATDKRGALRTRAALEPGGFAVLSADTLDPLEALNSATLRVAVTPWPSLNNNDGPEGVADRVVLRDAQGYVQDAVFYRAAWGAVPGRSLERLTLDADARGLLWSPSKDPSGSTPGRANSARAAPGTAVGLVLQPNPFSPDADGFEDLLTVAFEVPREAVGFEASLFDLEGRRRRWLAADRLGPGPRRLSWDGTDDQGVAVSEGVYLLRLELLGNPRPGGSQLRCIGLVRGGVRRGAASGAR